MIKAIAMPSQKKNDILNIYRQIYASKSLKEAKSLANRALELYKKISVLNLKIAEEKTNLTIIRDSNNLDEVKEICVNATMLIRSETKNRIDKINSDLDNVKEPKQLLELIDHYRQSAIKKVVSGGGSFEEKKGEIKKIFQATTFNFDLSEKGRVKFLKDDGEENLNAIRDRIKTSIIQDIDSFPMEVVTIDPVRKESFSDMDLLYRIVYNEQFITKTLDYQATDVDKDKALKCAFDQYKITGDEQQYPRTLEGQKKYIGGIFQTNNSYSISTKIYQDFEKSFKDGSKDGVLCFPSADVDEAYDSDVKNKSAGFFVRQPTTVSRVASSHPSAII